MESGSHTLSENNSFLLNIVRIVAAWMVLMGHCFFAFQKTVFKNQQMFPALQNCGFVVLFLLSGFLSAYSFRRKQADRTYTFQVYLIEKICRIWSGLIPALFFILAVDMISISINSLDYLHFDALNLPTFIGNLFFLQTVFPSSLESVLDFSKIVHFEPFGSGRPLWTLAIEWWLYIAIGFIILITIPAIRKKELTLGKLILTIIFCWQPLELLYGKYGVVVNLPFIFLLGFFLYDIYISIADLQRRSNIDYFIINMIASIISFFVIVFVARLTRDAFNFVLILAIAFFQLCLLLLGESPKWKITGSFSKFIAFFSGYTYSLYLLHYSLLELVVFHCKNLNRTEMFWLTFFLSHFFAIIMYYLFERHGRTLSTYFIHQYRKLRA